MQKIWKFAVAVISSIVAAIIFLRMEPGLRNYFFPPERRVSYSLTVQRMRDGKTYGEPFQSSGREIFESGDRFSVNLLSRDAGYFYIFSEGAGADGKIYFDILYPTPATNNGSAEIGTGQQIMTGQNIFGGRPDTEKLWLIWTKDLLPLLEASKAIAFASEGRIEESRSGELRSFLRASAEGKREVVKDGTDKHTALIGSGNVVVHLLPLEHR
jgi:hypothetical protein